MGKPTLKNHEEHLALMESCLEKLKNDKTMGKLPQHSHPK
jgi:hypothetical protein